MKELLDYTLFEIGEYSLKVSSIVFFLLLVLFVTLGLKLIRKIIYSSGKNDMPRRYALYSLVKYCVIALAFVFSLQILGLNITVLMGASAALLVGVGLGLKDLFSDFISGIVLLVDSSIKVNDILEVNGLVCRVQKINLRTTTVFTREQKYIILPNTELTRNQLINWTYTKSPSRFKISLRVHFQADIQKVMHLLIEAAQEHPMVLAEPAPSVRFQEFGDMAFEFTLLYWSNEVFRSENMKSEIRIKILNKFREHHIELPYPQTIIQVRKDVME